MYMHLSNDYFGYVNAILRFELYSKSYFDIDNSYLICLEFMDPPIFCIMTLNVCLIELFYASNNRVFSKSRQREKTPCYQVVNKPSTKTLSMAHLMQKVKLRYNLYLYFQHQIYGKFKQKRLQLQQSSKFQILNVIVIKARERLKRYCTEFFSNAQHP